jgi:hypothetical protein
MIQRRAYDYHLSNASTEKNFNGAGKKLQNPNHGSTQADGSAPAGTRRLTPSATAKSLKPPPSISLPFCQRTPLPPIFTYAGGAALSLAVFAHPQRAN